MCFILLIYQYTFTQPYNLIKTMFATFNLLLSIRSENYKIINYPSCYFIIYYNLYCNNSVQNRNHNLTPSCAWWLTNLLVITYKNKQNMITFAKKNQ